VARLSAPTGRAGGRFHPVSDVIQPVALWAFMVSRRGTLKRRGTLPQRHEFWPVRPSGSSRTAGNG
jgi:hypothetical protein